MIVTAEETDVTKLLWVVVIVDVDIWVVCCETLVILGVDFKVVGIIFVETPGGVILHVALGFTVVTVTFFDREEGGVVDGFVVMTVTKETELYMLHSAFERSIFMAERHRWGILGWFNSGSKNRGRLCLKNLPSLRSPHGLQQRRAALPQS